MPSLPSDLRLAVRSLGRNPILTLVAAASLGLGVGANVAIFTLVNDVFLRPLPMAGPERLVSVFTADERNRATQFGGFLPTSRMNFEDLREQNEVFKGMAAQTFSNVALGGDGTPEQVPAEIVSPGYFTLLGAPMAAGRGFLPDEERTLGAAPVTVLSYGLWQRRYGGDPALVGRDITINGRAFTVVGVAGPSFKGTNAIGGPQLWLPFAMYRESANPFAIENWDQRRTLMFGVTGRLEPGVTIEQAASNLETLGAALARDYPADNQGRSFTVLPLAQATINPAQRGTFVTAAGLLTIVVAVVLLVACVNVANMLLARAESRRREMAVRVSLGAGRGRLLRQLLTESLTLAALGGAIGLLVTLWLRPVMQAMRPPFLPENALAMTIDGPVLAFTAAIALVTGILFGLAPALQFSRPDLVGDLRDRGGRPGGGRRVSMRNALVVGQLALSVVALIGAGLFLRSLNQARSIDPGFDADRLAALSFNLASQGMTLDAARERRQQILDRVRGIAGVEGAAYASSTPLAGFNLSRSVFLEGQDVSDPRNARLIQVSAIGEGYLPTLGIPLVGGRDITGADTAQSPQVVIVNETMAAQLWPNQDAVGKRFRFFREEQFTEVIGVARDSKYTSVGEDPTAFMYRPMLQDPQIAATLLIRSAAPEASLGTVRSVVQQMEPEMPLVGVITLRGAFEQALWAPRMGARLLTALGGLALLLVAIGVYGVVAYTVSQRTRELGIRIALGASSFAVRTMVLRDGLAMTAIGIALGVAAALLLTDLVASLLYGISPVDPVTFGVIPILLIGVAAAAIYLPARRASRVDPVIALRGN